MYTYIGRQPILNEYLSVVAYSLLYNKSETMNVMEISDYENDPRSINGPLIMDVLELSDQKPAFIEFVFDLINNDTALLLNPKNVIVEIKEVEDDQSIMKTLERLKAYGYKIAVGSHIFDLALKEIFHFIDIVKIDFSRKGLFEIEEVLDTLAGLDFVLMASNVTTREQAEFAKAIGFKWFQGNYYMKQDIMKRRDIRSMKNNYLKLLIELNNPAPDFKAISLTVESDIALAYKVLRLVNSTAFSANRLITNVHQALVRIGIKELSKWIGLILVEEYCDDVPEIYFKTSIVRAKAMENLGNCKGIEDIRHELFLTGLMSMIDVILDRDMSEILNELPLSKNINEALLGEDNKLRRLLILCIAYEELKVDDWPSCEICECEVNLETTSKAYQQAIKWYNQLYFE